MRRKSIQLLVSLLMCFVLSGCFSAHSTDSLSVLHADRDYGIAIPGSDVLADTFRIDAPGTYYLSGMRLCKGTGIDINAHNVTIDLMGFALVGPGKDSGETYGVRTNNHQNLEIRNGTICDFGDRGIVDRGKKQPTGYKRIINVGLFNNGKCGICIGGPANLIKECICAHNGASGICPGYRSRIEGNLCYGNAHCGIAAGRGCNITDNNISENGQSGILAYCGSLVTDNCVYMNNRSEDPNHAGIIVMNGCYIQDNVFRDNDKSNILVNGIGNTIQDNLITALDHPGNSILLFSQDNVCLNNQIHGSKAVSIEQEPKEE